MIKDALSWTIRNSYKNSCKKCMIHHWQDTQERPKLTKLSLATTTGPQCIRIYIDTYLDATCVNETRSSHKRKQHHYIRIKLNAHPGKRYHRTITRIKRTYRCSGSRRLSDEANPPAT